MKYVILAVKVNTAVWGLFHGWKVLQLYWPTDPMGAIIVGCAILLGCGEVVFGDEQRAPK